ncbi:glycosyltransferase [Pseudobutyrivibrio xylanivorans]|uniref:Glycosyl transferase family 2 n=1 Tax=Pseudobutyrivibrio xylanivorans TaxID=185007 RepID=A0A5P6VU58_PSEXY|nr:glycosyltransferase [Pseudobutyrivibrio xylanivorans]QFJ55862.1 glycosyl transferase family 2 [Pseudobutyrivibrio xylanivorans]
MAALSVLMSLYIKEKTEYARECFESLLRQTVPADEWVIVEDGPLTDEMYHLLDEYQEQYPRLIKRVRLEINGGLGLALKAGVPVCSNELIARMDTDDIAREDRFEKQLAVFENNPTLDICGSYVDEFEDSHNIIVARRTVPIKHEDIIEYQKKRDAFNHVTVMFKKSAVLAAGNYQSCPLMEDTYLWARMIMSGAKCANVNESLVYVRIGKGMYERRGGWSYFKKYKSGQKMVNDLGYTSRQDFFLTVTIQFIVAMMPGWLRGFVFKRILHR